MSYKISFDANGSDLIHVHGLGDYVPLAKVHAIASVVCNGALTPPDGNWTLLDLAERSMNELLAANITYRAELEKLRGQSADISKLLDETPEALLIRLTAQIRQESQDLVNQMAARIEHLTKLAQLAQKEYIAQHSDGETDCVTPYDLYDQPGIECVRALQAEAGRNGFREGVRWYCEECDEDMSSDEVADWYADKVRTK